MFARCGNCNFRFCVVIVCVKYLLAVAGVDWIIKAHMSPNRKLLLHKLVLVSSERVLS